MSDDHDGSDTAGHREKYRSGGPGDRSKRRRKKPKHEKHRSLVTEDDSPRDQDAVDETEAEYDARLEREEHERRESEHKRELERVTVQYADNVSSIEGVRFKGQLFLPHFIFFSLHNADVIIFRPWEDEVCRPRSSTSTTSVMACRCIVMPLDTIVVDICSGCSVVRWLT